MKGSTGFTIVEMVATIVILAIALIAVSGMVALGTSSSADTLLETRAIALGQAYLDEITGRRFDENSDPGGFDPCYELTPPDPCSAVFGPEGNETTRDDFDDVDDYHGLLEGDGETTPIQDAAGDTRADYENFHVAITVEYAGDDPVLGLDATDAKLIVVTIKHRDQQDGWQFSVYKGNY
jgi:MSHA pilin protein MshD